MLKKSMRDSIKVFAKYQRFIDEVNRIPPWLYAIFIWEHELPCNIAYSFIYKII
jgi:hypothetical protein